MKRVAIFGSTGAVGRAVVDEINKWPDNFKISALSGFLNKKRLYDQANKFDVDEISAFEEGPSVSQIIKETEIDIYVFAQSGMSAIKPAFLAAKSGKLILLANKEVMVVSGKAFMAECEKHGTKLISLDHEMSAIDQCLRGEKEESVKKLILTASGGPFFKREDLSKVVYEEAIKHPVHRVGARTAINCSTLMNKGLELIEATHLFKCKNVDVVIHPQGIVQSLVSFKDGTTKALMATPDLSWAIRYGLFNKERVKEKKPGLLFDEVMNLKFYPKGDRFKCLEMAFLAKKQGGGHPAYLNGANEVLVERFCRGELSWVSIGSSLERLMNKPLWEDDSLEAVLEADKKARKEAEALCVR